MDINPKTTLDTPGGTRKSLGQYLTRIKSVLRRNGGSSRLSFSSRPPVITLTPEPQQSAVQQLVPTPRPVSIPARPRSLEPDETLSSLPDPETFVAAAAGEMSSTILQWPEAPKILRPPIDAGRALKVHQRFQLPYEPNSLMVEKTSHDVYRIEKPIRMRIYRTCHRCKTTFGSSKACVTCGHTRCTKCPRSPPKTTAMEKQKQREEWEAARDVEMADEIEVDYSHNMLDRVELTMPSKTGGQPLVRKRLVQRVRRTCHQCQTQFPSGTKTCGCGHVRCVDCPRDPAKRRHYPDGYPGDAPSSTSTAPIKFTCHECTQIFPPVPHPNSPEGLALGDTIEPLECGSCGHQRCLSCPRALPQKVEPSPDLEVVNSLRAKLVALNMGELSTP